MGVRRHLLVFLSLALLTAATGVGVGTLFLSETERLERELSPVLARADTAGALDRAMSRYGEAVASVILLGRDSMDGLQTTRVDMTRALARYTQATRTAISGLAGSDAVAHALSGLEDSQRIAELYYAIDRSTNQVISNQRQMQTAVAIQIFKREVAFRLDNEVQPLLDTAARSAAEDAAGLKAAGAARRDSLRLAGFAVLGLFALCTLVAGLRVMREARRREAVRQAALTAAEAEAVAARAEAAAELARRETFFTDISHELRTPLTVLRGEADIGLRGAPDAAALRRSLERVRAEAETMSGLVEDLLSLARAEAEGVGAESHEITLGDLVAEIVAEGRVLAATREIMLVDRVSTPAARLRGAPQRLRRAVLNGLDNAIKHTAPGGVVALVAEADAARVTLRVQDSGPGLSPEEKPHLFERFFRGAGEAELENPGLGIGLAIAKDIVRAHGGTITLDNRPEGGAELTLTLPRMAEAAQP